MKGLARINMVHVVVLSVSVVAIFIAVMTSVGWDFGQVYRALEPQGTFKLIGGSRSNSYKMCIRDSSNTPQRYLTADFVLDFLRQHPRKFRINAAGRYAVYSDIVRPQCLCQT